MLAAFAQFDNDVRSDRTRAGMKAALEPGRWVFLAPIGYLNAPRSMGTSLIQPWRNRTRARADRVATGREEVNAEAAPRCGQLRRVPPME